jgi:hypothetical protein
MALIKLGINNFRRDLGGIANRLVDRAVNRIEQKLENAVEDAFAKGLNKIGLSNGVAREISARFTDSISAGRAAEFLQSSTAEQNRVTPQEIENRFLPGVNAETTYDAIQTINTDNTTLSPIMRYPDQTGQYYMRMMFQRYYRPAPQSTGQFKHFRTIILPVPRDLKETLDINIDPKSQGVGGGAVDYLTDIARGAGSQAGGEFAILYSYAIQKTESLGEILGQTFNAVPNPHLQAIFSGVELRNHTFQWTFAPRNPQESRNLKAIIYEIKKNSLPAYSTMGTAALQYPPMVDIKLMPWATNPEKELIRFKKCLVKSVSVNYAPAGLPSFFKGTREPTMIQIEIQLIETEIQTANEYILSAQDRAGRADRLEQFKDAFEGAADTLGLGDALKAGKEAFSGAKDTVSEVLQSAANGD